MAEPALDPEARGNDLRLQGMAEIARQNFLLTRNVKPIFRNSLQLFLFYMTARLILLMNVENFEKAVGAFKSALKSRSNPSEAIAKLGEAYGLLGNEERELEYLEIAQKQK